MGKLMNRVAIITGGASGIGEATVRLFAKEGAKVQIADILSDRGERLSRELGDRVRFERTDVRINAHVKRCVETALHHFGRLDIMFNNAGIPGSFEAIDEAAIDTFEDVMAVNLRGVFLGMRQAARIMKKQGKGTIINTASIAGLMVGAGGHAYSASKAAIIHLTKTVAMELADSGLRVNCICPGAIATPFFGKSVGLDVRDADRTVPLVDAGLKQIEPLKRAGLPEDVAKAALWLAGEDAGFINGHTLVVDSGVSMGRTWSEQTAAFRELSRLKKLAKRKRS